MYKYRGFTLVELVVTIAVVGIIIALAIPSFNDMIVKRKLRGAAELVYSQLIFAKTQSIKESEIIRTTFADGGGGAWKFGMTNAAADCDPSTNDPVCAITYNGNTVTMLFDGTDFSDVTMSGGVGTITFDPLRGTAAGDSSITLATTDPAYSIQVDVTTIGRVSICSPSVNHVPGYITCTTE